LKKRLQIILLLLIIAIAPIVVVSLVIYNDSMQDSPLSYTYEIINSYFHDPNAFTQGLEFNNGFLFESTGLYRESTLRKVDLETGKVLENISLADQYFGEGITIFDNRIIQLTWISNKGFVYEKDSFELITEFTYQTEGWGITNDGSQLIMSDGSSTLFFLDPETFKIVKQVQVIDEEPVSNLNELEYIHGQVWANIWLQDKIAIINPQTGKVQAWVNLSGLNQDDTQDPNKVLNGIAYDSKGDRIFVTGKKWSKLFQIDIKKTE
jgi:glutamine cyclotransferase